MTITRRNILTATAATAASAFFGSQRLLADTDQLQNAIAEFAQDAEASAPEVKLIQLTTPEIAENGNSVPVSVLVESPMTEGDYVEAVMILADGNPSPDVATFNFTPMSGEAKASTRIRLAKTQNVVAVAKLSNGTFHKVSNNVKVTIGGCGG